MKQSNGSSIPVKVLRYLLMAFVLVISLYPILWVLLNSFKQTPGGLGLPEKWVFDGYITIFTKLNIGQYFLNSLIVTVISTVISVFAVSLAAYVSARISFKGKSLVTLMFASTLFIPSISISFPIYRLLSDLGLKDTLTGVIFVYASLGIAVTFFILRSYFLSIPKEMEEAAMMDGCGYTSTYFRIIVPIAKPGLATAAIMAFLNNWNEYYFASILLKSKEHMTLPGAARSVYDGVFQKSERHVFGNHRDRAAHDHHLLPAVRNVCQVADGGRRERIIHMTEREKRAQWFTERALSGCSCTGAFTRFPDAASGT